jgi:hypothetical protein
VNVPGEGERLPSSIGGLVDLGFETFLARAPLYVLLALATCVVCAAVDYIAPAANDNAEANRLLIIAVIELLLNAFVVALVALDVGGRIAAEIPTTRALLRGAALRWGRVTIASILVESIVVLTADLAIPSAPLDPLAVLVAPLVWLLWGTLALTLPLAALSAEKSGAFAALLSLVRAFGFGFHPTNFARLALLSLATIAPLLLETVLTDLSVRHTFSHAKFWCNFPVDIIVAAPLTAVQTAFALDFARRAGRLGRRQS